MNTPLRKPVLAARLVFEIQSMRQEADGLRVCMISAMIPVAALFRST